MTTIPVSSNPHNINAVLLLNKSLKASSNYALQKAKRLYAASKAGHSGSLDPLATGMLPICFGQALKFIEFLLGSDKQYQVTARLGVVTDTGDKEGRIVKQGNTQHVTPTMLENTLQQFTGPQQQTPPMFSAIKHQGQPLYKLARQGKVIERKSRDVCIHALHLLDFSGDLFTLTVHCSSGTYIRSLIQDIGGALDCGANVEALHRSHVADYQPQQRVSLSELEQSDCREKYLLPMESIVKDMRDIHLDEQQSAAVVQGQKLHLNETMDVGKIKLINHAGKFIGIGEVSAEQILSPRKICFR